MKHTEVNRLPGFFAEATLQKKETNYIDMSDFNRINQNQSVFPQGLGPGTWRESAGCWGVLEWCHNCGYSGGQKVCGGWYVCGWCIGFW